MTTWTCKPFHKLSNEELYKIIQLRIEVFVIEQNCPYQDCDNNDQLSHHLMGWLNNDLVAYTRLLPAEVVHEYASIGRVVTSGKVRGTNIGKELMANSINKIAELFGQQIIVIGAQLYLKRFYESFGFTTISDIYLEDNIQHIKMRYEPEQNQIVSHTNKTS